MASDGFRPLDEKSLVEYIKSTPSLLSILGKQFDNLEIKEVGDGNLNFVYIVVAPSGSIVIKQVPFPSSFFYSASGIILLCFSILAVNTGLWSFQVIRLFPPN